MRRAGLTILAAAAVVVVVGLAVSQLIDHSAASVPTTLTNPDTDQARLAQLDTNHTNAAPAGGEAAAPYGSALYSADTPGKIAGSSGGVAGAPSNSSTGTTSAGGVSGGTGLALPDVLGRKVIRNATLELTVEDVGAAVQQVQNAADAAGGFVSGSSLSTESPQATPGPDGKQPRPRQAATMTIKVPAESFAAVMSKLRGVAKEVRSENSDSSEVTEEYTDLQARVRNLQATEQQYLALLARAQAIPDILTVQDRLNQVRLDIEQAQGRIQLLDSLADMATITVNLGLPPVVAEQAQVQQEPGWAQAAWDNAWDASRDVLRSLGTAGITAAVVAAWLIVPGLFLLVGWRLFGGRRPSGDAA